MFCQKAAFIGAVRSVIAACSEESISDRGIDEMRDAINRDIMPFFEGLETWAETQDETINYGAAFDNLTRNRALAHHAGHISKHIALIQLAKQGSPAQKEVASSIEVNLNGSGHSCLWEALERSDKDKYVGEVTTATLLYHLLSLHGSLSAAKKGNPISTLRRSMRDRLPEEYFASLIAGWIAEDQFEKAVKATGAKISLVANDQRRRIRLKTVRKGKSVSINSQADFEICGQLFDLQRVNKISEPKDSGYAELGIKHHKFADDKKVIVWFSANLGDKFAFLKKGYCLISNTAAERVIKGCKADDAVVYVRIEHLKKNTTQSLHELVRRIKGLPPVTARQIREDELPFGDSAP